MHQLRSIRQSLPVCALVQAFVQDLSTAVLRTVRLMFTLVSVVSSAAARLVFGACRYDHITAILTTLHWFPACKTVLFKTVMLVWKCLNGTTPGYLSKLYIPIVTSCGHCLRSALTGLLKVPRARTTISQWSFAAAGSSLWNSLPAALQRPEMTLHKFK